MTGSVGMYLQILHSKCWRVIVLRANCLEMSLTDSITCTKQRLNNVAVRIVNGMHAGLFIYSQ